MKGIFVILVASCISLASFGQNDTTAKPAGGDTLHVGNMVIIKKDSGDNEGVHITRRRHSYHPENVATNWFILDLGFANYNDNTNYAAAQAQGFVAANITKDQLNLRTGKSIDVNLWFFMQRLNLAKHVVNLKYGLGLELNNYRFEENIKFEKKPTKVIIDPVTHSKDKLATDYITVPIMLNFNFTPGQEKGFGISAGISAGYLYSARQKFKGGAGGKGKIHGDFDLEKWKISYIGEIQLGPIQIFGSLATKSIFQKGLDITPYNIGIRAGNF